MIDAEPPLRAALQEELRPQIDRDADADDFSGVVLVAAGDDEVFSGAWGLANRAWSVPTTVDTLFPTASVAKLCTAIAVLQLVDAGAVALGQPIGELVPLAGTTIGADVTVRHLLSHTSGIADHLAEDASGQPLTAPDLPAAASVADVLPLFVDLPPRFPAGARYAYCNAGYVLLGRAVELVTGRGYIDVVTDRVLRPAGMDRACFPTVDAVVDRLADPHARRGTRWIRCMSTALPPGPDGGLAATAPELHRLWRALTAGRLLSQPLVERMLTREVTIDERRGYALGAYVVAGPPGVTWYEAHGVDHGVNAFTAHHPPSGTTLAVLSNVDGGARATYRRLWSAVTEHWGA